MLNDPSSFLLENLNLFISTDTFVFKIFFSELWKAKLIHFEISFEYDKINFAFLYTSTRVLKSLVELRQYPFCTKIA